MLNFSRWFLKGPWAILFIDEIIGMSWSNYSTPPCCCIPASLASFKDAIHRREKFQKVVIFGSQKSKTSCNAKCGRFHLHLLVVPLNYQFCNRMYILKYCWTIFFYVISRCFEMFCYLKYLLTLPLFRHNKVTTEPITFKHLSYHFSRP